MCDLVTDFFIFRPLDHTVVAGLPSNKVQHWEYVVKGVSGIQFCS